MGPQNRANGVVGYPGDIGGRGGIGIPGVITPGYKQNGSAGADLCLLNTLSENQHRLGDSFRKKKAPALAEALYDSFINSILLLARFFLRIRLHLVVREDGEFYTTVLSLISI
ncbi:hypothetical protein CLV42_12119 [Chitinophaga ginsengisoli]|uniref:Uncharacterized protein n=1 Tax=Chitinophaga ginsengisoli TaxID=363837 RepID=A0A2P8FLF2_9BACT|nr:hypothetical protein CLV42_12119 [Chitinophaga ginsengisoli]